MRGRPSLATRIYVLLNCAASESSHVLIYTLTIMFIVLSKTYLWIFVERAVGLRLKLNLVELKVAEYAICIVEMAGDRRC